MTTDGGDARPPLRPLTIFLGFAHLGLVSFGGAIAWARRLLVDEKRWLTPAAFNEVIGLGQVLPGPNVVNASVVIGAREAGPLGALAAFCGIMLPPLALVLVVATIFAHFGDNVVVRNALRGSALAGAGLIAATGLRMAANLRGNVVGIGLAVLAFALLAIVRLPLASIVAICVPVGCAAVLLRARRAA